MNDLDIYKQSVNQIFTCLNNLDTYLENDENSNTISNLNEYKELAISFSKLLDSSNNSSIDGTLNNISSNLDDDGDFEDGEVSE